MNTQERDGAYDAALAKLTDAALSYTIDSPEYQDAHTAFEQEVEAIQHQFLGSSIT